MPMDLSAQIDRLRTPGYRRSVLLRRLAAAALVLAAALHVLLSAARADPLTLTFARDVAPGTTLTADDVVLARLPAQAVPRGALSDPALAEGQVLAAAAAEGEVVTSVRLVGPDLAAALTAGAAEGEEFSMVPVPLAEPGIIPMLRHGAVVDVVGQGPRTVASGGRVVTVADEGTALVLLRQPEALAVAAAALSEPLTLVLSKRSTPFSIP